MRIVHTSDWHLGRIFCQASLLEDQAFILDRFLEIVRDAKADAVVIAGDLYDRAVPPAEAVALCDEVLSRLALDLKVPVVVIAGNHDSPERVGFGSKLMALGNVHIAGAITPAPVCIRLGDRHGEVMLAAIPYSDPSFVKACYQDQAICDHDSAMRCCVQRVCADEGQARRSVLIAHAFVAGGSVSESERPLIVGGTGTVNAAHFQGFSYTALGHLHRPQALDGGKVQYAGSLLKYSFDEASHTKSVNVVEIGAAGGCTVERVELKPRRDVRCISGKFADLLAHPPKGNREDYLKITLEDDGPVFEAKNRLRDLYPNVLELELSYMMKEVASTRERVDHTRHGPLELFEKFYAHVNEQPMTPEQQQAFSDVVDAMGKEEER